MLYVRVMTSVGASQSLVFPVRIILLANKKYFSLLKISEENA